MSRNPTPMQRQYNEIKEKYPDTLLFFRLGDFYEMFGNDAIKASKILGITLTSRGKGTPNEMPMCGIPHHAADQYIDKLTKQGEKTAICEQVSDPTGTGIVQREVVRVITPGTTLSSGVLDQKQSHYLCALSEQNFHFGIAFADLSTGEFRTTETQNIEELLEELHRISPAETIAPPSLSFADNLTQSVPNFSFFSPLNEEKTTLLEHFSATEKGLGLADKPLALKASGLLMSYLTETQKNDLQHIQKLQWYSTKDFMPLDSTTIKNLEIFSTIAEGKKEGALLSVIDKTVSASGGRKLKQWFLEPLTDIKKIKKRLEAVEELVKNTKMRTSLREALAQILDIERLLSKLACGKGNARDIVALRESLKKLPEIRNIIKEANSELLQLKTMPLL